MTENKSHLRLDHYLRQLKLPTMLREYAAVVTACTQDHCDYVRFLLRLVEREALDREKRAAERRVKNARFPILKTLDPFDFTARPAGPGWTEPRLRVRCARVHNPGVEAVSGFGQRFRQRGCQPRGRGTKPVTEAWLVKAAEDLDAIRALRGNPQLTGVIAFHAQHPGNLGLTPTGRPTEKDAARFEQFADHVHATVLAMLL